MLHVNEKVLAEAQADKIQVPASFVRRFKVERVHTRGRTRQIYYHMRGHWKLLCRGEEIATLPTQKEVRQVIKAEYVRYINTLKGGQHDNRN